MSLEIKNLVKKYGDKVVVNNLSFKMEEPGVYALLGTNGAGKTTTIRIILGMLSYNEGEILWDEKPIDPLNVNLGYLAEERGLYPKYTLMDQLLYFAKLKKVPKNLAKERIAYWAKRLEVEEYIYPDKKENIKKGAKKPKPKTADQLSKGNQQKIQMMCALLSDPEFIVLDEPLSGLDPVNSDVFKSIIRELIENKKYVIMSSHQMATIEEFCKDIAILDRGNVVLQGDLNVIKKNYGRVNMMIKCEDDIESYIDSCGMNVVNKTPDGYHIKVTSEDEAKKFLETLVKGNVTIIKYELREPSLHEIFVEKVGETHEEQ
ncbi:MAG: ATP-binding cassette domain-containing protein [Clostridiales bacterium]|nr:ATP-binding cassette domain-containing protein [Clostridiales bacterium]